MYAFICTLSPEKTNGSRLPLHKLAGTSKTSGKKEGGSKLSTRIHLISLNTVRSCIGEHLRPLITWLYVNSVCCHHRYTTATTTPSFPPSYPRFDRYVTGGAIISYSVNNANYGTRNTRNTA